MHPGNNSFEHEDEHEHEHEDDGLLPHADRPYAHAAGFEDENDDEDENEASCERHQPATRGSQKEGPRLYNHNYWLEINKKGGA